MQARPRHIVHLIYRFAAGGLENVIVQLVNGLPRESFRHTIVALTTVDPSFVQRIERDDVEIIAMAKPPGQPFRLYPKMFALFNRLRPDVLHSCNLAALEFQPVAWATRVPLRIHAEHGWDVTDPEGRNRRFRLIRRCVHPLVHRFIAVSPQLYAYLVSAIGIRQDKVLLLPNGVDVERFHPSDGRDDDPNGYPFCVGDDLVIGTVGRMEPVKNQMLLVEAFIRLVQLDNAASRRLRLVLVGDGPLFAPLRDRLVEAGLADRVWMPGARGDIPQILRRLDCFALPSLAEGTSCTLLEAMASGTPVVATDVGGNADVLEGGRLGALVPSGDVCGLAMAIEHSLTAREQAAVARDEVRRRYGLAGILDQYKSLFSGV